MTDIEARLKAASPPVRNQAIRDAREAGWTFRRIADTVGMSVGGVHKIINQMPPIRFNMQDGGVLPPKEETS